MTDDEIRTGILRVCKVASWDSDFNVVGFHALCDKLKELGASSEREACANFIEHDYVRQFEKPWREDLSAAIRARGNT